MTGQTTKHDDLQLSFSGGHLLIGGNRIHLCDQEYRIVALLAHEPGRIFTKEDICRELFGGEWQDHIACIGIYITHARRIIHCATAGETTLIRTVWGKGYRFAPPGE